MTRHHGRSVNTLAHRYISIYAACIHYCKHLISKVSSNVNVAAKMMDAPSDLSVFGSLFPRGFRGDVAVRGRLRLHG